MRKNRGHCTHLFKFVQKLRRRWEESGRPDEDNQIVDRKLITQNIKASRDMMPATMDIKNELIKSVGSSNLTALKKGDYTEAGKKFGRMIAQHIIAVVENKQGSLTLNFNDVSGFEIPLMQTAFGNLEVFMDDEVKLKEGNQLALDVAALTNDEHWIENFIEVEAETPVTAELLKAQILLWSSSQV